MRHNRKDGPVAVIPRDEDRDPGWYEKSFDDGEEESAEGTEADGRDPYEYSLS
jgi:hypothetical protein